MREILKLSKIHSTKLVLTWDGGLSTKLTLALTKAGMDAPLKVIGSVQVGTMYTAVSGQVHFQTGATQASHITGLLPRQLPQWR